ncbi:MAG: hypothetical protein ACOYXR_12535 [Nitrospirota bacterium]
MNARDTVDAFVAHLAANGHPGLKVERRPDDENHSSPDIDAIAGAFAIEHTSIDTLPNQRRAADWFMRAAGRLKCELEHKLPFRLNITIEYDAVARGQDWPAIRSALKTWVVTEATHLADGRVIVDSPTGIPFRLHVVKSSERRPGVLLARYLPDDDTLLARVRAAFDIKAAKLAKYQCPGVITVLLVENDALMSEWKMIEAIRAAFPSGPPAGVDRVWGADTSIPSAIEFRDFTPEIWYTQ